jgi:hypothetical protein
MTGTSVLRPPTPAAPPPTHPVPAGASVAVWSRTPTLGNVAGQAYLGRIVLEMYDKSNYTAVMGADGGLVGRAPAALRAQRSFAHESGVWPRGPIMGRNPGDLSYQGRAVIEFWSRTTNVAISVTTGTPGNVVQRAIQALEG